MFDTISRALGAAYSSGLPPHDVPQHHRGVGINTNMKSILTAAKSAFDLLGNPKLKNILLLVLALASAFGVIAPDNATSLRDAVTGLIF